MLLLAGAICCTLISGTIVVWWTTGVATQPVIECLVGLHHAEYAGQVGDKLNAILDEAQTALALAVSPPQVLRNASAGGEPLSDLTLTELVRRAASDDSADPTVRRRRRVWPPRGAVVQ